eukprot:10012305-Ditylum_brightwellii.AAC.1
MVAAHKLLLNYQKNPCNHMHVTTSSNEVAFVTEGETNEEDDSGKEEEITLIHDGKIVDRNGKEIECYNCGGNHYASKCPEQSEGEQDNKGRRRHKARPKKREKDVIAFNWGNINWDNGGPPGGLMFLQHATSPRTSYKVALMRSPPSSSRLEEAELSMSQAERQRKVQENWVLLDSQSTVHLFFNRHLLTNIQKAEKKLEIQSTADTSQTDD